MAKAARKLVLIHPGQYCPALGNGRRVAEARVGRKKVSVWLRGSTNAKIISRADYENVLVRELEQPEKEEK